MIDDKFIAEVEGILPLVYDDSLSYYEVLEKVTYLLNECIQKVNNIADPVIYTPTVNEDGTISWTNNGGLPNPEPVDISGPIGPAPSISVTDITGGHRITIVDEDHPDGINIDVMNGAKGEQGDAGVSPAITITDVLGGHRITITDAEHPQGQSFNVMNGDKGEQGDAGVSPTVTITDILGGHRITITDAAHPQGQNFDVMDGAKGDTGAGVPAGGTTGQILAKLSDADYDLGYVDDTSVKSPEIAVVITGARPSIAVTAGQYVIVRNSAISGITDGLYIANTALSPSTNVTAANLTAVSNGGLNSIKSKIEDSGWQYPTFNTGWSNYGTDDPAIKYRKVGKMVEVSGCVKPDSEKAIGEHTILTLPSGYRPSSSIYTVCAGSTINKIMVRVDTYGNLKVSRYGSVSITTIPNGAWLAIHITYFAD